MPDAFVARQPIFNDKLEAVGYELLFRANGYVEDGGVANRTQATATVILNTLTELDLRRIVGRKRAWINVSRDFVLEGLAEAVPPKLVGLEVLETEHFDDELVSALRDLRKNGYRLALDGFASRPGFEMLLPMFDVVKLDMVALGRDQLSEQMDRLDRYRGVVLAEKLTTHPDHAFAADAGVDLFQGYFYCRPAVIGTRGIAANRVALMRLLADLQNPQAELSDISELITRDVTLSFRLLRYVNSAYFGLRGEVRSVSQALALLGLENVRRWTTLSALASIDGKPSELTRTALTRARFCEVAGEAMKLGNSSELFTLGLFSVVDAMMDAPMAEVVESLPFATDLREALVGRRGKLGMLLDSVTALEAGEEAGVPLALTRAGEAYLDAMMWATTAADTLYGVGMATSGELSGSSDRDNESRAAWPTKSVSPPSTSTPPPGPIATDVARAPERPRGVLARIRDFFQGLFAPSAQRAK
jgi:EAL and modified HD-GYP domain-containing signal transduction protein